MKHDITAQVIKISAGPRKYNPTISLCFGYPQNFKHLNLNIHTVLTNSCRVGLQNEVALVS